MISTDRKPLTLNLIPINKQAAKSAFSKGAPEFAMRKSANTFLSHLGSLFVLYISAYASDAAEERGAEIIEVDDLMEGMKASGFGNYVDKLKKKRKNVCDEKYKNFVHPLNSVSYTHLTLPTSDLV
eukprot:TRINITY_DN8312_c0_g1_i9.p1 TRINITY_DN8312_c0_g1~~TRINITY_DN8312_c0_g1_i9.p1  ORF type:complete len:126 (+),score=25.30 TRINITY_DN8312_c0_g1_i9:80-457(+)